MTPDPASAPARTWSRRRVLQAGAGALTGAGLGWSAAAVALPVEDSTDRTDRTPGALPGARVVEFHGPHQAGVSTPPPAHLSLLGLDLRRGVGAAGLARLMRLLSDDAARLTRGRPALADTEPELAFTPAALTVTFGFGPRIFDEILGGAVDGAKPLPPFATDALEKQWRQTDLAVQICADDPTTVAHARRMLLKDATGLARPRWIQNGFRDAYGMRPDGTTMRNLMGQVDGTANPAATDPDFAELVWSRRPGLTGGTFLVLRRIRVELETWDQVDRAGREAAVGRRLDNGAPLTGRDEHDVPDFAATDALGLPVIDPASHIARARSANPAQRFLRRGYNYCVPDPSRPTGEDSGLVFVAFAADVERQFVPVQRRLAELDRLNQWITTIGSAVYAVPPGCAEGEFVGQALLGMRR
ncbi:Dyp-type peroxidase [Sporichthya brevicatena]|uniref:Dyp-type peroxidase n=1 Tax=Sporichthya brevicatena TaxID=171442 RepID=A0ABN1GUX0_9ACTN